MRRLPARALVLLMAGMVAGPLLVACTSGGEEDERTAAEEAVRRSAERVATALAAGAPEDVSWFEQGVAEVAEEYDDTLVGFGGLEPQVSVIDVTVPDPEAGADADADAEVGSGDEASARLAWSWPIADDAPPWEYRSTVTYRAASEQTDATDPQSPEDAADTGAWAPVWARSILEPSLGEQGELLLRSEGADRGEVTGARGEVLVTERRVLRFGVDKSRVGPPAAQRAARALAGLVDVAVAPFVARVKAAGERAFVEAITYRAGEVPDDALSGVEDLDGARAIADTMPLAPTREFAAPLLGRVGPVTAEMVQEDPETYQPGDVAGVSGLQARYDDQLRGRGAVRVIAYDPGGDERELFTVEAEPGQDLALTLDRRLQRVAEDLLAPVAPGSALVAIRPSDGAILAAANGPGTRGLNHATYGQFPPGSTFKVVSALALMRNGLRPDAAVDCPATTVVDGKQFENYDEFPAGSEGRLPFATAFSLSCNTAFITERGRLGDGALAEAAASLGLGVDHDLGFPAYLGQVPAPASATEQAADLIGQGRVLASPMAMATVIASVQQGSLVVPRLVEQVEVERPDGVAPLGEREAVALRDLLRLTVTSGTARILADVPGPPVRGKTGTAEFRAGGAVRTHAWMVAGQGNLAVAVFVERGASGSGTAGPILEGFLRQAR